MIAFLPATYMNMASKKLRRARLPKELCERLSRHQITTCQDFLSLSLLELMKVTGQNYWNVQKLLCTVSQSCAPRMQTVYEMKMKRALDPSTAFLPTTLKDLDNTLHGGIACGCLTELTGPSGCGKTQFCIMMSMLATLPTSMGGLDGSVIYIDTESAFSAERLLEIAQHRFPQYFATEEKLITMPSNIHLYRELTCESVLKRIESLEEEIISKNVKLVVIDSVASVVRKEFDTKLQGNLMERNNLLTKEASTLKFLAEEFSIPVILTNQITTWLSDGFAVQADPLSPADDLFLSEESHGNRDGESGYVTAALGNTWSHSVNTRLILQYLDSQTRQLLVAKSPIAPFTSFQYTIENSGLVLQASLPPAGSERIRTPNFHTSQAPEEKGKTLEGSWILKCSKPQRLRQIIALCSRLDFSLFFIENCIYIIVLSDLSIPKPLTRHKTHWSWNHGLRGKKYDIVFINFI
ncbi:DNA repair protein RAD51 homolog 2 isoform X2 [Hemicordylus capensis]|uniref:DNA repair protein RAD51 homolog 2 isoform X2 n=1 Tax=Hemicordylus capensis TaxID=884348 RepID=UPI0023021E4D|nr:DNA repair protein RAD51 homolog 2 isoform X2 [Hemicordylus capensis]